jgi:LysM repeat protein
MGPFKAGDQLTDAYINKLKTNALKEQAHQLNRRTEFRVLRKDFVPTPKEEGTAPGEEGAVSGEGKDAAAAAAAETGAAAAAEETPAKAAGQIHVCEKGDTYGKVAKQYGLTLKELKDLNGIKSEQIRPGMELKVDKNGDYTEFDAKYYTLEKGEDSWNKVAKKLGKKSTDLKKLNKGVNEDLFRPGFRIKISE